VGIREDARTEDSVVARKNTQFSRLGRRNETFQVDGIDDVATALAEMGREGRNRAMTAGFDEGSAFILHEMKRRVPRQSGDLARNLTRVVRKAQSGKRIGQVTSADIGPRSKGKRDRWWSDRARWLEYGTRDGRDIRARRGKALSEKASPLPHPISSAKHRGMRAQPFMRPTIDENVAKIAEIMLDAIRVQAKRIGFTVR
jgi:HK97 gp10 family phage protein